jgi:hypothetical protein
MRRPTLDCPPASFADIHRDPVRVRLDEIRSALISAICHAHRTTLHDGAPPFLTPMPLARVVEVLVNSGDPMARTIAGCWLLDNKMRLESDPSLNAAATALLGADRRNSLVFEDRPGSISFDSTAYEPHETRFTYACDKLLPGLTGCDQKGHQISVTFDLQTLVTSVSATVIVNPTKSPPSHFRQQADPRGWETSAPLFFIESRLCDLKTGDFETRPNPPVIGNANYDALLLEYVSVGFAPGFPIDAINVLNVGCGSTRNAPNFHVSLHVCLETLFGFSWSRAGLDVDRGTFVAEQDDRATRLTGTKVARFTERELFGVRIGGLLNRFAPFSLAALMSMLIFGGACYEPK